ncbi:MAG TPA: undecaprenyl-diphosphate phosphatase, partial [Solirubrobacteraceae bacterium]|nr:undecaprenyl-diphosphate phosphatase [Solirubrobacteraceae bacterium]
MPPPEPALRPRQALALGLLQGPAELLPISSSAHTALAAQLVGWRYGELDGATRKSFEVSLHAGAGLGLALALRGRLARLDRGQLGALALSLVPPALAGLALRRRIERHLGGPRSVAAGLLAGSGAMVAAEVAGPPRSRGCGDAGAADGVALGLAQAFALVPGVSRSGATLAAARARGFAGEPARALSLLTALPVLTGAGALDALGA